MFVIGQSGGQKGPEVKWQGKKPCGGEVRTGDCVPDTIPVEMTDMIRLRMWTLSPILSDVLACKQNERWWAPG